MADSISWIATVATIIAASITASNLGSRITGYGFVVFLFGSLAWLVVGATTGQPALLWTNAVLTLLNLFGIWRWLGRQAKLEEGGESALEASRDTPGEALFPASCLSGGAISRRDGKEFARAVDAMVGARSGRVTYVVAATGGVAGVAEELRRLDWRHVAFEGESLRLTVARDQFDGMPLLERDDWPGR